MDANAEYRRLKRAGYGGWGGERFSRRFDDWSTTVVRLMQDDLFPKPPARLLELGCGNGVVSSLFAQNGYTVAGLDLCEEAVRWADELFKAAGLCGSFRQGDVSAMPFYGDRAFDVVIDGNCLHCVIGPDRSKCLNEVRRVLRSDGLFFVSSMCGRPKSDEVRARFDDKSCCLLDDGRAYRTLKSVEAIKAELTEARFAVRKWEVRENPWWDHLNLVAVAL